VTRALLVDLDDALWPRARARARELWRAGPVFEFCRRIGMSPWEGLWCRYEGGGDEVRALRAWAPGFRREAWRLALADQCIDDEALAAELGERFGVARRGLCETFADAPTALDALRGDHAMGLVTNGASCLQREKLAASGLADRFDAIVVSGDLGRAKPDAAIFAHAVRALGAEPGDAVIVGG
jgi:putative hydrolase of the HAD superfamily